MRQNGMASLSVAFYRGDDLQGTIGRHRTRSGRLHGCGRGARLRHRGGRPNHWEATTYWAFAQANESLDGAAVGDLWNYGANVWGWEDTRGGGDRDFNDLVIGIDFTSASGHRLLA